MADFEVEQDFSQRLTPASEERAKELAISDRGVVLVANISGEVDVIYGSRYLTDPVGYLITDGLLEIRVSGRTEALRTYRTWSWVEGDKYKYQAPQMF